MARPVFPAAEPTVPFFAVQLKMGKALFALCFIECALIEDRSNLVDGDVLLNGLNSRHDLGVPQAKFSQHFLC